MQINYLGLGRRHRCAALVVSQCRKSRPNPSVRLESWGKNSRDQMPRGARWYAKSITNHARAYQAGLAHFMPFSYTVLVLVVIGAALIWGATLDSQGRIVVARAGKAGTPQFQPSLKVFGMYCSLPARAYGVLGGKPGVFRPASIHEYCLMAGKSSPGNFGLLQQYRHEGALVRMPANVC